jgi:predicted AlkP superfamily phosphohydrolase/phosphomutase
MMAAAAQGKLLIIGLDGATWRVIEPLIERGKLPNLARLIRDGTSGNLRSLEPMISTMLWTSISSGKLPDEHGVRDFAISSRAVRCKRLWDIFGEQGLSVGIYGHLITWPPEPVEGFMVPGTFALGPETHPPELAFLRRLAMDETSGSRRKHLQYLGHGWRALRNGVRPSTLWRLGLHLVKEMLGQVDPLANFYIKRALKLHVDRDVFCHLCGRFKPQFTFFYTHLLDSTQHLFWKFREPDAYPGIAEKEVARYGHLIEDAYQKADEAVGRMLSVMGRKTTVMVISDHGAQAAQDAAEGSAWNIKTEKLLRMMGLWEQVRAVNIGFALYLCPRREGAEERDRIRELFQGVVAQENGTAVFEVTPMEYWYLKIQVQEDDIDRLKGSMVSIGNASYPFEDIVEISAGRISGTHHPDGICILWGESIRSGVKLHRASLLDVAPTALMLMGLPVAKDMAGQPLLEAVREDFLKAHPISFQETYEDQPRRGEGDGQDVPMPEELAEKLRALGYLG